MRILIDISHPAHVHFFKNPIRLLCDRRHRVLIGSRDKDCTLALLDNLKLDHECLSRQHSGSLIGMARELIARDCALVRLAREFRPDVITGLGGICAAHAGFWLGVPSVVFYDTENARMQNALTYPAATKIVVPECYGGWSPRRKTIRYRGYHELAYLHPKYFSPSRQIALSNGLARVGDTFLIRVVSWQANHDIGERGWSSALLETIVRYLSNQGKVIISAEGPLPASVEPLRFKGDAAQLHHLLAFCRAYAGESATMASEAAVLGVPGMYAASTSRGYVDEQDQRYGLVKVTRSDSTKLALAALEDVLAIPADEVVRRHKNLLDEAIDVSEFVASTLAPG